MKRNTNYSHAPTWQRVSMIVLCVVLALLLCFLIGVTAYAQHLLSLIDRPTEPEGPLPTDQMEYPSEPLPTLPPDYTGPTINPDDVTLDTAPDTVIGGGNIVNIMLIGQDRRPNEHHRTRSDSMILCTFNRQKKTITMTSFMRDMYVQIPGHKANKMNASYAFGGMRLLKETMAVNFGVHVDACVEVDFAGFTKVIDLVGGVDIVLTEAEAKHMNSHDSSWHLVKGMNHLNGAQALDYARIRKIGSDFGRTERQRKVLTSLAASCRDMSLTQVMGMIDDVLPLVTTDMTNAEIISYAGQFFPLLSKGTIATQRIPANGTYENAYVGAMDVLIPNLEANRQILINTLMGKK